MLDGLAGFPFDLYWLTLVIVLFGVVVCGFAVVAFSPASPHPPRAS
jgi:hypothetical protein